jgi:hypothetical protein
MDPSQWARLQLQPQRPSTITLYLLHSHSRHMHLPGIVPTTIRLHHRTYQRTRHGARQLSSKQRVHIIYQESWFQTVRTMPLLPTNTTKVRRVTRPNAQCESAHPPPFHISRGITLDRIKISRLFAGTCCIPNIRIRKTNLTASTSFEQIPNPSLMNGPRTSEARYNQAT